MADTGGVSNQRPFPADLVEMIRHRRLDARQSRHDPLLPRSSLEEEAAATTPALRTTIEIAFPCCKWIKNYSFEKSLFTDLISGISVGIMVIPQGMSYAKLAGLPVQYGLYSAVAPVFAYAVYGSSNQLAVGPVAMVSLLFYDGLAKIVVSENDMEFLYEQLAVQSAAIIGIAYLILSACRMGSLTTYLSHSVISGFTTGAAVLIAMSQCKHLLGYDIYGSTIIEILWSIGKGINSINYFTFGFGGALTSFLLLVKYLKTKVPRLAPLQTASPLLVTVVALLVPNANDALPVVGEIPQGLPSVTLHAWWPTHHLFQFLPTISSILIVGFMESIAIAKQLAMKHNDTIDSNAELFGLGMANLLGGAFHAYPITGSFSRSAVNSNAHSPLSGAVTATTVCLSLLFLTPIFQYLPLCALAAIVVSGVASVLDVQEAFRLYDLDRGDFAVWMTACMGVLCLGVEFGLMTSIVVSFAVLVPWKPSVKRMGRLADSTLSDSSAFVDEDRFPETMVATHNDTIVLRLTSSLNFANVSWVVSLINEHVTAESRCIVLDTNAVTHVDSSARQHLQTWLDECMERHLCVYFVGCSESIEETLISFHAQYSNMFYTTVNEAVVAYGESTERGATEGVDSS